MQIDCLEGFKRYLRGRGCRISRPKTQWEFLRYRCPIRGLQIVYVNKHGRQKIPKVVQQHWREWEQEQEENSAHMQEMMNLLK